MPRRSPKRPIPAPTIEIVSDWALTGRDRNHNYYERNVIVTRPNVNADGFWAGAWVNKGEWVGEWLEPKAEKQTHKETSDGLNYQDNDTGAWKPFDYAKTVTPTIHPEVKPDFPAGESFCEEQTYARKYARVEEAKQPLMGLAWRGETGTADDEVWLNLRTVGADISVVPVVGTHDVTWPEAWPDTDYNVTYYDADGWEFRIKLKTDKAANVVRWTIKRSDGVNLQMDPDNPTRPAFYVTGVKRFTFGPVTVWVDGIPDADFPLPTWEIIPASPYDILQLTIDPVALASAFSRWITAVEVRC